MERREFIKAASLLTSAQFVGTDLWAQHFRAKRIGACDWSLGKRADPAAFDIAKSIALAGVQVSLGTLADDMHLRKDEIQKKYLQKSQETGVKITSLAIGELNNVPYKSDPRTDQWVADSIDVAHNLKVQVILLAFFNDNDLRNDPKGMDAVIGKLKEVAPLAEKKGIVLGIESYLTAKEHLYIMDKVGSDAIKVYYDFRNAKDAGNDIFEEIKLLGDENICEIHIKENGKFLGDGDIDWQKVSNAIDDIGFSKKKWSQIEWSLPAKYDYINGHSQNLNYLKKLN